ncbi:hypothetical protein Dimus_038874 [Dionaea muscipula]
MTRAAVEDDELRVHLDCRHSRRLSPSPLTIVSHVGSVSLGGLPLIIEDPMSRGVCSSVEDFPEIMQASSTTIGILDESARRCPVSASLPETMEKVGTLSSSDLAMMEETRALSSPIASLVSVKETAADHVADGEFDEWLPDGGLGAGASLQYSPVSVAFDLVAGCGGKQCALIRTFYSFRCMCFEIL